MTKITTWREYWRIGCREIWLAILRKLRLIPPLPPEAWEFEGNCPCCGRLVQSNRHPVGNWECIACAFECTPASRKRAEEREKEAEDRRQIELYKTAIREMEEEKKATTLNLDQL